MTDLILSAEKLQAACMAAGFQLKLSADKYELVPITSEIIPPAYKNIKIDETSSCIVMRHYAMAMNITYKEADEIAMLNALTKTFGFPAVMADLMITAEMMQIAGKTFTDCVKRNETLQVALRSAFEAALAQRKAE